MDKSEARLKEDITSKTIAILTASGLPPSLAYTISHRMYSGWDTYGPMEWANPDRDLKKDVAEEIADGIAYTYFLTYTGGLTKTQISNIIFHLSKAWEYLYNDFYGSGGDE